jgi:hypothetical protein
MALRCIRGPAIFWQLSDQQRTSQNFIRRGSVAIDRTPDMDATVRTQSLLLFENRPKRLTRITVHLTFELDRNP